MENWKDDLETYSLYFQDVQDTYAANSKQVDIVTAGCTYRDGTSLTVHGKVTDFQMWGKALSDEQLVKVEISFQSQIKPPPTTV